MLLDNYYKRLNEINLDITKNEEDSKTSEQFTSM